jgi:prophage DNA circulation protein
MQEKIKGREYRFPVKFHVIKQEIETWLLSDEHAISRVIERNVPRVNESLEDIQQSKEKLKELLSKFKANYTAETLRRIAEQSDIEKIALRCPGFQRFRQSVLDC